MLARRQATLWPGQWSFPGELLRLPQICGQLAGSLIAVFGCFGQRFGEHGIDATTEQVPEKKGPGGKVIEEAKTVTKIKAAKGLADYDQEKAIELVQACNNLKDLKSWSKAEVRPGVAVAIKDQIEKIEKTEGEE